MNKNKEYKATINANGAEISVVSKGNEDDYISLTDIAKYKSDEPNDISKQKQPASAYNFCNGVVSGT